MHQKHLSVLQILSFKNILSWPTQETNHFATLRNCLSIQMSRDLTTPSWFWVFVNVSHLIHFSQNGTAAFCENINLLHIVAILVNTLEPSHTYYLSHRRVLCEQSTSTKLRTVFNGSTRKLYHVSLNDMMCTGPRIQSDNFNGLSYIQQHKYIVITEVTKMFHQIKVHEDDWDLQNILWLDKVSRIRAYR